MENDDNLLREVVGDYKNDKKKQSREEVIRINYDSNKK